MNHDFWRGCASAQCEYAVATGLTITTSPEDDYESNADTLKDPIVKNSAQFAESRASSLKDVVLDASWSLAHAPVDAGKVFGWRLQGADMIRHKAAGVVPFAYRPDKQELYVLLSIQRKEKSNTLEYTFLGGKVTKSDQADPRLTAAREAHEETHCLLDCGELLEQLKECQAPFENIPDGGYVAFGLHLPDMWNLPEQCAAKIEAKAKHPEALKAEGLQWVSLHEVEKLRANGFLIDPLSRRQVKGHHFLLHMLKPGHARIGVLAWLSRLRAHMREWHRQRRNAATTETPAGSASRRRARSWERPVSPSKPPSQPMGAGASGLPAALAALSMGPVEAPLVTASAPSPALEARPEPASIHERSVVPGSRVAEHEAPRGRVHATASAAAAAAGLEAKQPHPAAATIGAAVAGPPPPAQSGTAFDGPAPKSVHSAGGQEPQQPSSASSNAPRVVPSSMAGPGRPDPQDPALLNTAEGKAAATQPTAPLPELLPRPQWVTLLARPSRPPTSAHPAAPLAAQAPTTALQPPQPLQVPQPSPWLSAAAQARPQRPTAGEGRADGNRGEGPSPPREADPPRDAAPKGSEDAASRDSGPQPPSSATARSRTTPSSSSSSAPSSAGPSSSESSPSIAATAAQAPRPRPLAPPADTNTQLSRSPHPQPAAPRRPDIGGRQALPTDAGSLRGVGAPSVGPDMATSNSSSSSSSSAAGGVPIPSALTGERGAVDDVKATTPSSSSSSLAPSSLPGTGTSARGSFPQPLPLSRPPPLPQRPSESQPQQAKLHAQAGALPKGLQAGAHPQPGSHPERTPQLQPELAQVDGPTTASHLDRRVQRLPHADVPMQPSGLQDGRATQVPSQAPQAGPQPAMSQARQAGLQQPPSQTRETRLPQSPPGVAPLGALPQAQPQPPPQAHGQPHPGAQLAQQPQMLQPHSQPQPQAQPQPQPQGHPQIPQQQPAPEPTVQPHALREQQRQPQSHQQSRPDSPDSPTARVWHLDGRLAVVPWVEAPRLSVLQSDQGLQPLPPPGPLPAVPPSLHPLSRPLPRPAPGTPLPGPQPGAGAGTNSSQQLQHLASASTSARSPSPSFGGPPARAVQQEGTSTDAPLGVASRVASAPRVQGGNGVQVQDATVAPGDAAACGADATLWRMDGTTAPWNAQSGPRLSVVRLRDGRALQSCKDGASGAGDSEPSVRPVLEGNGHAGSSGIGLLVDNRSGNGCRLGGVVLGTSERNSS